MTHLLRNRLASFIGLAAATLSLASVASADLPPLPAITADRAFVGDVLRGLEFGDPGVLYTRQANSPDGEASTTKTFTLLLAAEAIDDGVASYDDAVPMSANALSINLQHSHGGLGGPAVAPGTLFRLEDLLTTMILDSDGDATVAVAEHIARRRNPALAAFCNINPFICLGRFWEIQFVARMNTRAAEIGLVDTLFFNPYGGDHGHDSQGNSTGSVAHETTARELSMWFDYAMESNATFRDIIGRQGTYTFQPFGGGPDYTASTSFGYDGILGQKGGSNTDCETCAVAMSERIGRKLVMSYMQSDGGDGTALLDYGFGRLFHPLQRGQSDPYGLALDQSLSCVSPHRAASAVVNPDGTEQIHLFALGKRLGSIVRLREGRGDPPRGADDLVLGGGGDPEPIDDLSGSKPTTDPELRIALETPEMLALLREAEATKEAQPANGEYTLGEDPRDPGFDPANGGVIGTPGGRVIDIDLTYAQNGHLALGVTRESLLELSSWGIPAAGPAFFRAKATVGTGTDLKVYSPHPGRIITAYRDEDGTLRLGSWLIDGTDGSIHGLASIQALGFDEFRIAGQSQLALPPIPLPQLFESHFVIAGATPGGKLRVASFKTLAGGAILQIDSDELTSDAEHVRVARVGGRSAYDDLYAVAYRAGDDDLTLRALQRNIVGGLSFEGSLSLDSFPVEKFGSIEIAPYRDGGVMVGRKPTASSPATDLIVVSIDTDVNGVDDANWIVDERTKVAGDLLGLCRIPSSWAEGDFLVATQNFFDFELRLEWWRSAQRDACGLGFEGALAGIPIVWMARRRKSRAAARLANATLPGNRDTGA